MRNIDYRIASSDQIQRDIGERLNLYRVHLGIQQEELAREAGISRSAVGRILNGHGGTFNSFLRILQALKLHNMLDGLIPEPQNSPLQSPKATPIEERERVRKTLKPEPEWTGFSDDGPVFEDEQ